MESQNIYSINNQQYLQSGNFMNPSFRSSQQYRSPGAMKKNSQQQIKSPQKPGTPAHIIQLKPKNMQGISASNMTKQYQRSSQGAGYKIQNNIPIKNVQKSTIQTSFPIKTNEIISSSSNIEWRTPPESISTPFNNAIFNQPIEKHEYPSPYVKYKIIPILNDKKCIDLTSIQNPEKKLKKNYLQIWTYHGGPNQQFYINKTFNNKYYIISVTNGFSMEVPQFSRKEGTHIHANPKNETENEWWELKQNEQGFFEIVAFNGKVLDMQDQSDSKGTRVIQWDRNGGKNQLWKIVPS